ncbi:MAG: hypothetical protein VXX68_06535 [Candidatus Neomarinimicrobiota bacterium]|nr:hypothetical protein [Candidatus Neomarinimicrobiota bacterium]
MKSIKRAVLDLNRIQKGFLTVAASLVIFWFLDGFGIKPLEDIIFRFINITFSWSFDSNFSIENKGYIQPDFIFTLCIVGIYVFRHNKVYNSTNEEID